MEKDKLQFARNYNRYKDLYNKVNKMQKEMCIAVGIPSLIPAIFLIFNPLFLLCLSACLAIGLPLIGFSQYRKHEIIKECNVGCEKGITYKDFKNMLKSRELENLIQQIREEEQQKFNEEYQQSFRERVSEVKQYHIKNNVTNSNVEENKINL